MTAFLESESYYSDRGRRSLKDLSVSGSGQCLDAAELGVMPHGLWGQMSPGRGCTKGTTPSVEHLMETQREVAPGGGFMGS